MPIVHKYELPPCLEGIMSVSKYDKLLNGKADTLRKRDLKLGRPFALKNSKADYKAKIHAAFLVAGPKDPYTGDTLRYDLVGTRNTQEANGVVGVFDKEYFLKPVVDHSDPYSDELEFEICSWIVNSSKTLLNPQEYVDLCRRIVTHAG